MTVDVAVHEAGTEILRVEAQEYAADAADGRRPAVPAVADAPCYTLTVAAAARGGAEVSTD